MTCPTTHRQGKFISSPGAEEAPASSWGAEFQPATSPCCRSTVSIHICKLLEGLWVHKGGRRCSSMFWFLQQCPHEIKLTGWTWHAKFHAVMWKLPTLTTFRVLFHRFPEFCDTILDILVNWAPYYSDFLTVTYDIFGVCRLKYVINGYSGL